MSNVIPPSSTGYAVDVQSGEVHTRYAGHAAGLPRIRRAAAIAGITRNPYPCSECFPPPPAPAEAYICSRCHRTHQPGSLVYEAHR